MSHPKRRSLMRDLRKSALRNRRRLFDAISDFSGTSRVLVKAGRKPAARFCNGAAEAVRRHPLAIAGLAAGLATIVGLAAGRRRRA